MLDSVIFCRDKWLKLEGMMFPDEVNLYITAINDNQFKVDKYNKWYNVYGVSMGAVKKFLWKKQLLKMLKRKKLSLRHTI